MVRRRNNQIQESFIKEDKIEFSLYFFGMALLKVISKFICVKIVFVTIFEVSHLKIKLSQEQIIIINLITFLKDISGYLYG